MPILFLSELVHPLKTLSFKPSCFQIVLSLNKSQLRQEQSQHWKQPTTGCVLCLSQGGLSVLVLTGSERPAAQPWACLSPVPSASQCVLCGTCCALCLSHNVPGGPCRSGNPGHKILSITPQPMALCSLPFQLCFFLATATSGFQEML